MSYTIEITRHVVSYRTRAGVTPNGGQGAVRRCVDGR